MTDRQTQHGNVVEVKTSDWQVKAAFGTALIAGIIALALMFRWQVGVVILVVGGLAAWRLGIEIKNQMAINAVNTRLQNANVDQVVADAGITQAEKRKAEAEADAAELDLKRAAIGVRLHHFSKIGVLFFHDDGSYDLLRERRSLTAKDEALALAAENPEPEFRPSLIPVMTQVGIVYVVSGAQRSGKSWQAGHIADYWIHLGVPPIVIGSKTDNPGYDWAGCNCTITDNKQEMAKALLAIMTESGDRQKLLKTDRKPQPVILDDWIATLEMTRKVAYQFMGLAGTTMASSGLIPYIVMHSDTVGAFGLKQLGAMLKNSFMKLAIVPIPDAAGVMVEGQSRGDLIYPNSIEAHPVDLITGRPGCFPDPAAVGPTIEGQPTPPIPLMPEDKIRAALAKDQALGIGKLQEIGWGSRGGKKHQERRDIIDRIRQETTVS